MKRNRDLIAFWQRKERLRTNRKIRKAKVVEAKFQEALNEAADEVENEIYRLFGQYARQNKLTFDQASRYLKSDEYTTWKKSIYEYLYEIETTGDTEIKLELETLAMKSRITRLEATLINIRKKLDQNYIFQKKELTKFFTDEIVENYIDTSYNLDIVRGMVGNFGNIDDKTVKKILQYPWSGQNFEKSLYLHNQRFIERLEKEIVKSITIGKDLNAITETIEREFYKEVNNIGLIVHTEHAYVSTQADKIAYLDNGIHEYQYLATLDDRTSSICRRMDYKVYRLSQMQVGVNAPPMHPYCRSTTIPYIEDMKDWSETRTAVDHRGRDVLVDANTDYKKYAKAKRTGNWDLINKR